MAVLVCADFVYARRLQIETQIWHWRHGHATTVGDYEVPVPDTWYPQWVNNGWITLVDSRVDRSRELFTRVNMITVDSQSYRFRDLDSWMSLHREWAKDHGLQVVEEKTFHAAGVAVACFGDNQAQQTLQALKVLQPSSDFVAIECVSTDSLGLMFQGRESSLPEFYAIASQIQKLK